MFLDHEDDAVGAAGEVHQAIFENDKIRVLKVIMPPGHKTLAHWHPKNMGYVVTAGKLRFTLPTGEIRDADLAKGQVTSGEGSHSVQNIGDTEVEVLQVEFKS